MGKKMVGGPGHKELMIIKQKPPEVTHFKISADPDLVKRIAELAEENKELKQRMKLVEARLKLHEPSFPGDFLDNIELDRKLFGQWGELDPKKGEK